MANTTTAPTKNNNKDDGTTTVENDKMMTICPDGHSCENGSVCAENTKKEGQYFCDCSQEVATGKVFTGLYCQHEASVFCTETGDYSKVAFCANEGICLGVINKNNHNHVGCECPQGYTGKVRTVQNATNKEAFATMPESITQPAFLLCS
jgi:hypothetical protein